MYELLKELERNKVKIYEGKESYIKWLSSFKYEYFITLTFKYQVSDSSAYSYLKFFLHLLNQKAIGKGYKNKVPLTGVVVLEYQWNGNPHFHLAFEENKFINSEYRDSFRFSQLVDDCCSKVTTASVGNYSVMYQKGVDVQLVYETNGLIFYETKTLGPNFVNADNLSFFKGSDVFAV
mgnify:CR=1 FL=1